MWLNWSSWFWRGKRVLLFLCPGSWACDPMKQIMWKSSVCSCFSEREREREREWIIFVMYVCTTSMFPYSYILSTAQGCQNGSNYACHFVTCCFRSSAYPGHIFYVRNDCIKSHILIYLTNTLLCVVHLECFQMFTTFIQVCIIIRNCQVGNYSWKWNCWNELLEWKLLHTFYADHIMSEEPQRNFMPVYMHQQKTSTPYGIVDTFNLAGESDVSVFCWHFSDYFAYWSVIYNSVLVNCLFSQPRIVCLLLIWKSTLYCSNFHL